MNQFFKDFTADFSLNITATSFSLTQKVEAVFQFVLNNTHVSTYDKFLDRETEEFKTLLSERNFTLVTTLSRQFERSEVMVHHFREEKSPSFASETELEIYLKNFKDFLWIISRKYAFVSLSFIKTLSQFIEGKKNTSPTFSN